MTDDHDDLLAHLNAALDAVLAARALAGIAPDSAPPVPGALDVALHKDPEHRRQRRKSTAAMDALRAVLRPEQVDLLLRVEECLRAEGVSATDTAWRCGWDAGRRVGQFSER